MATMDDAGFDVAECLERVRRRDEDAARELMEFLYPLVLKVIRAHLPRRLSEEDLVQMVFLKVFVHLDQYQGRVPLTHWVSRIAVNTCHSALKAEKVRPELRWADLSDAEQAVVDSLAAEAPPSGPEAAEFVNSLLARLSPADRLVIRLLHLEEKSVAEIRDLTGWSIAGVKVRAFRARQRLQKMMRKIERPL